METDEKEEPTREPDDPEQSGMPENEEDLPPLGADEDEDEDKLPGFPARDEPEIQG